MAVDIIKEINNRNPQETLQSLGHELKNWKQTKPEHYTFSCIFHEDKKPSAYVNFYDGAWWYGCSSSKCEYADTAYHLFAIAYHTLHSTPMSNGRDYEGEKIRAVGAKFGLATGTYQYNEIQQQERPIKALRHSSVEDLWKTLEEGRYWGVSSDGRNALPPYNHSKPSTCYTFEEAKNVAERKHNIMLHQVGLEEHGFVFIDIDTPRKNDEMFDVLQRHLTEALGQPVAIFHSRSKRGGHIVLKVENNVFGNENKVAFNIDGKKAMAEEVDGVSKTRGIEIFTGGHYHHYLTRKIKEGHEGVIPSMSAGSFEQLIKNVLGEVAGERIYEEYFEEKKEDTNNDESTSEANTQIDDILQRTEERQHKTLESLQSRFKTKGIDTGFRYVARYAKNKTTGKKMDNSDNTRVLTINEGLTIFASYTGGGKSTMLATVAHKISQEQEGKILYISLEEVERNLLPRLLLYNEDVSKIVQNNDFFVTLNENCLNVLKRIIQEDNLPEDERKVFDNALAEIHSRFLVFYEQEITADILYNLIKRVKEETEISAIFLDYIQILGGSAGGTEQLRIKNVMSAIRSICKDTSIPFIAGAQTSNGRKGGGNEKTSTPIAVGDTNKIRESDDIGQSASLIVALNTADRNFVLLKNREGELGRAGIVLKGELGRFVQEKEDLSREITPEGRNLEGNSLKDEDETKNDTMEMITEHEKIAYK